MQGKRAGMWSTGPLKLLVFFMENPYGEVYLRQAAKNISLSPFAVKKYADLLLEENLITEERRANLRYFKANTGSLPFRHLKIAHSLDAIAKSGLVEYILKNTPNVSSIVLFGSTAQGEDDEKSDLDIVVIGARKQTHPTEIEGKLGREINTHVFSWAEWKKKAVVDKPFYKEVVTTGIPLHGEMPHVPWRRKQ